MSWQRAMVAASRTHHEIDGVALYSARFDEVLSFHEPGLAAVRSGGDAWHVREDGSPASARRFLRTFGFYDRLATVVSRDGWHHISADGADLGKGRFGWCGNYQEQRCTVRTMRDRYLHLDCEGRQVTSGDWRYAGDFREGVAVVQAEDGRSTHIDRHGSLLHRRWFLDLDTFHKGFARARDADGWMHIDRSGRPVYKHRFSMIEPFYNGQARVELVEGNTLAVIDESGDMVVVLRSAGTVDVEAR